MNWRIAGVVLFAVVAVAALLLLYHPGGPSTGQQTATTSTGTTGPTVGFFAPWSGKEGKPTTEPGEPSCSLCHWNPGLTFWKTSWHPARTQGDQVLAWNLTVEPSYPQVALATVQASTGGDFVQFQDRPQKATWNVSETWSWTFDVKPGATGLLVESRAQSVIPTAAELQAKAAPAQSGTVATDPDAGGETFQTTLALTAPDGTAYDVKGPEENRHMVQVEGKAVVAGTWTATATLSGAQLQGQPGPAGAGVALVEVLQGQSAGPLVPGPFTSYSGDPLAGAASANFTFPATDKGGPPNVSLRFRPYQDHHRFYQNDLYDEAAMDVALNAQFGPPAPPHNYTKAEIDALWQGRTEYVLQSSNTSLLNVYTTDASGRIDRYVTGKTPYGWTSPSDRTLLPGATSLRFQLTWTSPTPIGDFAVKFKPGRDARYFPAQLVGTESSQGTSFTAPVDRAWWDDPLQQQGYWDIAAFRPLQPSAQTADNVSYTLTVYAER